MINPSRAASLACLFLATLSAVTCGDKPDVCSVSLPDLKASDDKSIVSLQVEVNAGSVQGMANVPLG
jgi:hypothetical protein